MKCIRVADALWDRFGEIAAARGTTRTALLREWIQTYVDSQGKRTPRKRS